MKKNKKSLKINMTGMFYGLHTEGRVRIHPKPNFLVRGDDARGNGTFLEPFLGAQGCRNFERVHFMLKSLKIVIFYDFLSPKIKNHLK